MIASNFDVNISLPNGNLSIHLLVMIVIRLFIDSVRNQRKSTNKKKLQIINSKETTYNKTM